MLSDLKTLGKETMVYGLSTVVARLLNFLLLPFHTHYLAKGEYGAVAALFAYMAFFNVVYQHGMDQAYMRFAVDKDGHADEEKFSTAFWSLLAAASCFSAVLFLSADQFALWGGLPGRGTLVRCASGILLLDALSTLPFADLRLRRRAWLFAAVRSLNIVLTLALNVWLLAGLRLGAFGVMLANLVASAATLILLAPVAAQWLRPVFKGPLWSGLLRFALPLVPAGLGSMAVHAIDRPILLHLADEATVGLYQANYRLAIVMMLAVNMFEQAWRPFYLQRSKEPDSGPVFGRVLTYYLGGALAIVLAFSLFMPDIVRLRLFGVPLIHPDYWAGLGVVPIVLTGELFYGLYMNFMASVQLSKRTDVLPWATLLGAAVKILGTFALVPYWKLLGAAWATLASYAAMSALLFLFGRRVYPIPYERGRLLHLLLAAAASAALAYGASVFCSGGLCPLWKAAALLFFPALLWATGFLAEDEREALKRRLSRA